MHDRKSLGFARIESRFDVLRIDRVSPLGAHDDGLPTSSPNNIGHPFTEDSVDADDHFIAGLDHVHEGGFHASASRGGNRNRYSIARFENISEHRLDVVHALQKKWVEVSEHRRGHRFEHAILDGTRPGAEEHTPGWLKLLVGQSLSG